jgi:Glyoxalase-like domain
MMRIDHVLFATHDLDVASERMQALGLEVVPGGRHEGLGTHNRIVPLGAGYLELIAVADPAEAAASPIGRAIAAADGLMGWAVAVPDVAPHAERLGVATTAIARQGLTASLAGVAEAMADPSVPFFIARDEGVADPGAGTGDAGIARLDLRGDAGRVRTWLGGAELPVAVEPGPPAVVAVHLGDGRTIR